ncbi:alpha/beta hydrolase [Flavobacterium soli]|uniref:alpha/beta hydrolase n=1 Tax=Flavobacterium soli TaxID=344881 RepID=UPI00040AF6A8|nr:alpha/beta fold hydrolase [Flavobacterium soli]
MQKLKFIVITFCSLFAILYLIILSYLYFNQEDFIFQPAKLSKDYKFQFDEKFEELKIRSFDNINLNGLLFKAEKSKGLIFYLHGNAGALDSWGNIANTYTDLGYDIFILDYRGFGKSGGEIESEEQFYKDVTFAYKKMLSQYPENKVIIVGYSVGTGPATYLASTNNPKVLILQAPYYNFSEMADSRFPFLPGFVLKYKFATNQFIPKVKAPIYIFHGDRDQVISFSNSVKLQKLLKPSDRFFPLKNQDHLNINDNIDFIKELRIILKS